MATIEHLTGTLRHETDRTRIVGHLRDVAEATVDLVGPQSMIGYDAVEDTFTITPPDEPFILPDGVYPAISPVTYSRTAWRHMAERLGVPLPFLDRLHADHRDLAGINLNTLSGRDGRRALARLLRADDAFYLRAVLSDRFQVIDNLDALTAITAGMSDADIDLADTEVEADVSTERFRLRVAVPTVSALVPDLLSDYRGRGYSHRPGTDPHAPAGPGEVPPVMWAGIEVTNSETGGGAFTIAPRAVVLICRNGLTRTVDAVRSVHIGGRLESGTIDWSTSTRRANLDLIASMTADAVRQFCSADYLQRTVNEMRAAKAQRVASPSSAVEVVQRTFAFTEAESRSILDAFIVGGDHSVLGLGQAVTAAAQDADDSDRQSEMENAFWGIVNHPGAYATAGA
jgi:hypothetical protein